MTPTSETSPSVRLARLQAEQRVARDEAMVDYQPIVCGMVLLPVSLMSMSRLRAFGNAFVTGAPASFEDIANFVWIHHPDFGQFAREKKEAVTRACWRALHPRWPLLNAIGHLYVTSKRFRWLRRFLVPTAATRYAEAIDEIRRLLEEAWRDFPMADDENGEPVPYAFEAYILNAFRRELHMDFETVRAMPLRRVVQHLREIIHHSNPKTMTLMTRAEAAIWRDHLGPVGKS